MKSGFKIFRSAFVITGAVVLIASCGKKDSGSSGGKGGKGENTQAVFAVYTAEAGEGQINDYLSLAGDIVAGSTVDTFSDAQGKITRLFVSVGKRVSRGDPIASVDPSKPGMTYVQHIVRAPITGTIISLPGEVGATIAQSTSIAKISGGDALEIRLYVPERFVSKIKNGLNCEITLDAYPGETFRGSINEVSPTIDPVSRTEEIKINVDNPGSKLKAGMFAKVKIITESKAGVVKIPYDSIIQRGGSDVVFVVEADPSDLEATIVSQHNVVTGIVIDGMAEIVDGLEPGDEIVVKGMSLLTDGARVNVISTAANNNNSSEQGASK